MKKTAIKLASCVLLGLALVACSNHYTIQSDGQNGIISSHQIPSGIVRSAIRGTTETGLMRVEITLHSTKDRLVSYRVLWLDKNGFELKNSIDSQYRTLYLNKNKDEVFTKIAQDKRAADFKIQIQE